MTDIDINPFGEHQSRPEEPMGENIPLTPVGGGSAWEPEITKNDLILNSTPENRL